MDPDTFSATLLRWDQRGLINPLAPAPPPLPQPPQAPLVYGGYRQRELLLGLEEFFQAYGIRYSTAAKIADMGFTVSTLLNMRDEELDEMMTSLCQLYRFDLMVGERYGIKAAVRAERRRFQEEAEELSRRRHLLESDAVNALDALSQEGLSEEQVQQEKVGSGGSGWEITGQQQDSVKKKHRRRKVVRRGSGCGGEDDNEDEGGCYGGDDGTERQREHPFIVTEPGEVARGKKNGLDYLFHLYEQCREFLIQVQNISKQKGEKCPSKVTNEVFRHAKKVGATYINKPKMRHYVHCYAFHCLDEEASNALRRSFKERRENVGAWRQACYKPLVTMAAHQGWDIDTMFAAHPRLSIWYVPTVLRQMCHAERSNAGVGSSSAPGCVSITGTLYRGD
ncbi:hypothetical protein GIB67_004134 [Kingdonia uniflora]|uniref:Floricaula/leafy-like transcription factor n=1 Tax=Kingdonia uniflora TaxID=39325 RepID=A0A7J7NRZ7_9MAGN|nr:hypothetical protein GIB67_004134 [Kingdonia uniflora]